jgi:hypothetical protein
MTGVNGWFAANQRTPSPDMALVGMNALLMKGRKAGMSARLFAPAGALASRPNATVSQVRAIVSIVNTAATAIQAVGPAEDRNPSASATR